MKKFEIIEMSDGKLETADVKYSPLTKANLLRCVY